MNQLNRRKFLQYSSLASAGALTLTPSKLMAMSKDSNIEPLPYTSLQTHLLNRISFGINTESISKYQELGYKGYIDYQLDADNIDDSKIEDYIAENLPTVNMSVIEIMALLDNDEIDSFDIVEEIRAATFLRAVYSKKQLLQVMVEFWSNHFNVFHLDGRINILKTQEDRDVVRPYALSTFSEILHADAKSPAMIYYLDTFSSTKEAPNENYARELMELHTLGVDGSFNHNDIDEVARCFTGWRIQQQTGGFRFDETHHDYAEKQVLGHTIAAGGGVTDGEQVLDILATHDDTAAFLATKLCKHFISDNPDRSIVKSTTNTFIESGGDIKQCLRHILLSKHFMISRDKKLKRPFQYIASTARCLSANILNNNSWSITRFVLRALGHLPFNWQTPDGYPDFASYWESTTGMLYRWNFISAVCFKQLSGYEFDLNQLIVAPHTPENVYRQIVDKVIFREMNSTDEINLIQYLIDATNDNNTVPLIKIEGALAIALSSPYFQLS